MAHLERAFDQIGHRIEDVRLIVVTHAHPDHSGQAPLLAERAGCEVWMHPAWTLHAKSDLDRRIEVALQSGVPEEPLRRWAELRRGKGTGQADGLRADRDLVEGVVVESDVGAWTVVETPGHAPSHVCLHQPERRLLISGDHLLGRVSPYFDVGYTPDPVGEFLQSLDKVDALDTRLALAGHARPFTDVRGHIDANRQLVARMCDAVRDALADGAAHRVRALPARLRRPLHPGHGQLAADDDPRLARPPPGARRGRTRRSASRAAGTLHF